MTTENVSSTQEASSLHSLVRCLGCRWWQADENRYNCAIDPQENPATYEPWESEEERRKLFPYEVRYCKHPKVLFYERPAADGAAVFDGSEYMAYLATGPEFGCVNGEAPNAERTNPEGASRRG